MGAAWNRVSPVVRNRMRAALRAQIDAGQAVCPFCGRLIEPGAPFDLDHSIPIALDVAGEYLTDPEYARASHPSCNRASGAALGNRRRRLNSGKPLKRPKVGRCATCGTKVVGEALCLLCSLALDGVDTSEL